MRILLVEDDQMSAEAVSDGLKNACYAVDWGNNGNMAEQALAAQPYDFVLLDLDLPERDGLQVLRHLRQTQNHTLVLIVTARDDLESRLAGLDGGADDYIIKPFDLAELLARIRAVLRRQSGQGTPLLTNGSLSLNPTNYQVSVADQAEPIILSNKEFAILQALMNRPGIIHSRAELEDKVYAWGGARWKVTPLIF